MALSFVEGRWRESEREVTMEMGRDQELKKEAVRSAYRIQYKRRRLVLLFSIIIPSVFLGHVWQLK